jgi:uncharacterized phiE125 gp8 family phage protein
MIKVITAPAAKPVTVDEAKEWCRIDSSDDSQNGTIAMIIAAMTNHAEHLTGRAFVERTLELSLDRFPHCIELPWAPLLGIVHIKYTDTSEAEATVDSADYEVDTVSEPGRVRPISGEAWPSIGTRFNPVRIRYNAGYRPSGSPTDLTDNSYLPGQLRTWIAARISTLYDNRDQLSIGNGGLVQIPRDFADGLLDSLVLGTRLF